MGKNGDKTKNFVNSLQARGHLERMVNNRGNYHITHSELRRMGVNVKEAANHFVAIMGDRKSVIVNNDGVSVKDASQKMFSYCCREGIDTYQPATELTEPIVEQPSELTY